MGVTVIRARSPVRVAASVLAVTILNANSIRVGAIVYNDSQGYLYLKYGPAASSMDFTVRVASGSSWAMPEPAYTGLVTGAWSAAISGEGAQVTEMLGG